MSLETDYIELEDSIEDFVNIVYQKAVERYRRVDSTDTADTLEGRTPTEVKNILKDIIKEHALIKGQNVHNQSPEDVGTLSSDEIIRFLDTKLSSNTGLPVSLYGDCTNIGIPIGSHHTVPIRPDLMFPGAYLELDDMGTLYILRGYTDGNDTWPFFTSLINARNTSLKDNKATSCAVHLNLESTLDPGLVIHSILGQDEEKVYFSTRRSVRGMQGDGSQTESTPHGHGVGIADIPTDIKNKNFFTVDGRTNRSKIGNTVLLHKVTYPGGEYFIEVSSTFSPYVANRDNLKVKNVFEFIKINSSVTVSYNNKWNLGQGFISSNLSMSYNGPMAIAPFNVIGSPVDIALDTNHRPFFHNYVDSNNLQRIAMFFRYTVMPVSKFHPPLDFYVRLDPIVTKEGHLDFSEDLSFKPTLEYSISGFKWLNETGAPFKHPSFLNILNSHHRTSILLEKNVGFIYDSNLNGSEFKLSRFRFDGDQDVFIRDMLPCYDLETEDANDPQFEFPTKDLRLHCGFITGYSGDKKVTMSASTQHYSRTYYADELIEANKTYYTYIYPTVESIPVHTMYQPLPNGAGFAVQMYYVNRDGDFGNRNYHYYKTRDMTSPGPVPAKYDKYFQQTGESYIYNLAVQISDNSRLPNRDYNWNVVTTFRIISDENGNIPINHPPLSVEGDGVFIDEGLSSIIRSQIVPHLPSNHTMFTYEMAWGYCLIRFIVPNGNKYKLEGYILPYVHTSSVDNSKVIDVQLDFSKKVDVIDNIEMNVDPLGLHDRTCGPWYYATLDLYNYHTTVLFRPRSYIHESFKIRDEHGVDHEIISGFAHGNGIPRPEYDLDIGYAYSNGYLPSNQANGHVLAKLPSSISPSLSTGVYIYSNAGYGTNTYNRIRLFMMSHLTKYYFNQTPPGTLVGNYDMHNGCTLMPMGGNDHFKKGLTGAQVSINPTADPHYSLACIGRSATGGRITHPSTRYLRVQSKTDVIINGQHATVDNHLLSSGSRDGKWYNIGIWVKKTGDVFSYHTISKTYTVNGFELGPSESMSDDSIYLGFVTMLDGVIIRSELKGRVFLVDGAGVSVEPRGASIPTSLNGQTASNTLNWN